MRFAAAVWCAGVAAYLLVEADVPELLPEPDPQLAAVTNIMTAQAATSTKP
jgi:hypothetical protein